MKKLFLVAGEISGDHHGTALLEALGSGEPDYLLSGLGGPGMHRLSGDIENWLDRAAVLGLWEVLKNYRYFKDKMEETVARIHEIQPDGIILIDYPGFNLRLARRLRDQGYRGKLIYYISPQVWAWKKGRVKTMARLLDLMICIFPFEKDLYESSGLRTVFCGHPLIDSLDDLRSEPLEREANLVALLPGSREREIAALFPPMLEAAKILKQRKPELRFATSGATPPLCRKLAELIAEAGLESTVHLDPDGSRHVMRRSIAGVVASGTATLEAAILGLPYCLTYKVAWVTAFAARRVIKIQFLGIVNVIAGREIVRELLQEKASGRAIADELEILITDGDRRSKLERDLARIVEQLGGGGAHERAAHAVATELQEG